MIPIKLTEHHIIQCKEDHIHHGYGNMDANRMPKATYFAKIIKAGMQTCQEKSQ